MRMFLVLLGMALLAVGCRSGGSSGAQGSSPSSAGASEIPRYASNIVKPATAQDAQTTVLSTSDGFDVVVAFFDTRMTGWKRMAIPAQHLQQVGGVVMPASPSPGGNKGLVRWTELNTSTSVTVTDRDGSTEIMEYRPAPQPGTMPRAPAGQVESQMGR